MTLKTILVAACLLAPGAVYAQQNTPAQSENPAVMPGNTPAVNPSLDPAPGSEALKPGANSFTEAQARERLEKAGYSLAKTQEGFWRGQATKNGASIRISLDFRGTISGS